MQRPVALKSGILLAAAVFAALSGEPMFAGQADQAATQDKTNQLAQAIAQADTSKAAPCLEKCAAQKPVWLTELSFGIKEGYDNNVYMAGANPAFFPGSYSGPTPGSVAALKGVGSFFTTLSPKLAVDLANLLDDQAVLKVLAFSYAPDITRYSDASSENYTAHRFAAKIAGESGDLSFLLDEGFIYIDGNKYGPTYPGGYYSAYGQAMVRERRAQDQDRTTLTFKYDQDAWFFRPTASLLDYNLETKRLPLSSTSSPGTYMYLNFVDRSDFNGGGDLGYKLDKDMAVTLGYRVGEQIQQKLLSAVDPYGQTSSSDYQRLLLGIEGKLTSWLTIKYQGGPDFRVYGSEAPIRDDNTVKYYGEGSLTATPSDNDTIVFNYKQWQWVSGSGKVPYCDSTFDLSYTRKLTDVLSLNLGARLQTGDYRDGLTYASTTGFTPATAITNLRDDWFYTFSAGLRYTITTHVSVDLAYVDYHALNEVSNLALAQLPATKRQLDDQIVTLGIKFAL